MSMPRYQIHHSIYLFETTKAPYHIQLFRNSIVTRQGANVNKKINFI
nr:MAG TPA: hypothetical protein [Caudoviricetes sp.]